MSPFDRIRRELRKFFGAVGGGLLFFVVLTPLALLLRLAGRDRLQLRPRAGVSSYWLIRPARGGRQTAMTRQY